ncbi:zinc finger protein 16-like isoform X2 [Maniola hyperantus]|uniref:zinc finger protein 16-like isoform X2 n=1 Tax=Aphantopus hyperantus TaxID=2795564 RepID=UPI00374918F7
MRCCVPFCENTSDNVSTSEGEGKGINFHGFPSEEHLRAAWLRALGQQNNLSDTAVVCSQHFINDDFYEAESGLRQIHTGAIPSTVQVCMICLDTDSKLLLISKRKLEEAYEKLTGQPLCDQGNLKHTLCVQCAQRLMNFSRFRDKSLRARALMMDLVEKHELITREHIQMINRTKHQLKSNMVLTTLGPDHCDIHILEHPSEDKQAELEETGHQGLVKTEGSDDSMSVEEDIRVMNEDDNHAYNLKDEFTTFDDENISDDNTMLEDKALDEALKMKHVYMPDMSEKLENGDGDGECETPQVCKPHTAVSSSSAHSSLTTENRQADPSPSAHSAQTLAPLPVSLATNNDMKVSQTEEADTSVSCRYNRLTDCFVKLYDVFSKKVVPRQDRKAVRWCVSQNIVSKDMSYQATSDNEVSTTESVKEIESKTLQSKTVCLENVIDIQCSLQSSSHMEDKWYICDICETVFKQKSLLVNHINTHAELRLSTCKICQFKCKYQNDLKTHMRTHTGIKRFSCTICNYKCARNSHLVSHMTTHTGIKPYACKLCNYKSAGNSHLVSHMRTHTGERPFSCKLCDYKCTTNSGLVRHTRTHTGLKPFSCKLCDYKFARNSNLVTHMTTHTGIKSFSCKICNYKCARNDNLVRHMRTHTGIKPFSCKLCNYKCAQNSHLVSHMTTHTGIKPYACKLCNYKCAGNSHLVSHMRTHTGERPFSCKLCDYKCTTNSGLVRHTRTHTGIKPFSCKLCDYKFARNSNLVTHMTTHTGIKSFSCKICNYKCARNNNLVTHMRTHTGIKPFSCKLCNYKCAQNSHLVTHMTTHTGIKPFSCKLCNYKCAQNNRLVMHMRTHTGEKPYSCEICEYKCAHKCNLINHIRTHTATGEKPSSCS